MHYDGLYSQGIINFKAAINHESSQAIWAARFACRLLLSTPTFAISSFLIPDVDAYFTVPWRVGG